MLNFIAWLEKKINESEQDPIPYIGGNPSPLPYGNDNNIKLKILQPQVGIKRTNFDSPDIIGALDGHVESIKQIIKDAENSGKIEKIDDLKKAFEEFLNSYEKIKNPEGQEENMGLANTMPDPQKAQDAHEKQFLSTPPIGMSDYSNFI